MAVSALSDTLRLMTGGKPKLRKSRKTVRGGAGSFAKLLANKSDFLIKTFGLLITELVVTALVAYSASKSAGLVSSVKEYRWLYGIFSLIVVVIMALVPMPVHVKAIMFTVYSATMGLLVSPEARNEWSKDIVWDTMLSVFLIFVGMLLIGVMAAYGGAKLAWLGFVLFFAMLAVALGRLFMKFVPKSNQSPGFNLVRRSLNIAVVLIFAMFVFFDTWNILQRDYRGDFVTAAMDYYLDIINLFLELIRNKSD